MILLVFASLNAHFFWTIERVPFPTPPAKENLNGTMYMYDAFNTTYSNITEPEVAEGIKVPDMLCYPKPMYETFLRFVWPMLDMLMYSIVPALFVIIGNILIIGTVIRSSIKRRKITPGRNSKPIVFSAMTATLLAVSLVFIATTTPIGVVLVILNYKNINELHASPLIVNLFNLAVMWSYFNYAFNFYLYLFTGSRFRKELHIVCCGTTNPSKVMTKTKIHEKLPNENNSTSETILSTGSTQSIVRRF